MEYENKLFNEFMYFGGLVLFNKIKELIEQEISFAVESQLQQRIKFQTLVINKVNNAGWDDENTHSQFIDLIRKEGHDIHSDIVKYDLEDEF